MKIGGSENKQSALEMSARLTFSFVSPFTYFQETFIQGYRLQFGYRKEVKARRGRQLLVWNLGENLDPGPMPSLNTVARLGSRSVQVPRVSVGGMRRGSLHHLPAS